MEYLLVDAYNVINAWTGVFNLRRDPLEDCRDKLLTMLSNFQGYKKIDIIVVFDAHLVKGSQEKTEKFDNLTVVFTKENESADIYIERFVYKLGTTNTVRVVTSDYLEQRIILSGGGIRVSPRELLSEIMSSGKGTKQERKNQHKPDTIMSRLDSKLQEKMEKMRRGEF